MNTVLVMALANGVWADAGSAPVITWDVPWPLLLGGLVSVVLPLLVGLVTKVVTKPNVRALLLALFAALTGLGTEVLNAVNAGAPYNLGQGIVFAFLAFLIAVGMHFGIYKPTGTDKAAQRALGGEARVVPIPSAGEGPGVG